jgi:6-phosphofructokinase 1
VRACIVTCGGLCPGLNTVIREIVCGLHFMYGVTEVIGVDCGFRGFYSKNTVALTPKTVSDIHKRGGTILGTSRGGHDTSKIVDNIQDREINQVFKKNFVLLFQFVCVLWRIVIPIRVSCFVCCICDIGLHYWR